MGQVLTSCGTLGLDWERTSLAMYLEACEAHNAAMDPKGAVEPASDDFRAMMRQIFAKGG